MLGDEEKVKFRWADRYKFYIYNKKKIFLVGKKVGDQSLGGSFGFIRQTFLPFKSTKMNSKDYQ